MTYAYWNYSVFRQFQTKIYQESLSHENVMQNGSELFLETLYKIDEDHNLVETTIDPPENRHIIILKKDNENYILPAKWDGILPIKPKEWFKCQIKKSDKTVYKFITKTNEMKITPVSEDKDFKKFVSKWNPLKHTSERDWLFLKMVAIASKYKGIKLCICSSPSAGKNSNFTLMNCITEDVCRIQKPTLAKLETVCYYNRVVLPDEVTSLQKAQIAEIEPTILWVADNSPEYNKHSMAKNSKMNKVNLTDLSVIFTYNRKQDLSEGTVFFDDIWQNKAAFQSRYPHILLDGEIDEHFPTLSRTQAIELMEDNFESMRKTAKEYVYWINNIHNHLHHWVKNINLSHRHSANMEGIFDVLDVYCDTQQEYDDWMRWISNKMLAYRQMVKGRIDLADYNDPMPVKSTKTLSDAFAEHVHKKTTYTEFLVNIKSLKGAADAETIRKTYTTNCDQGIVDSYLLEALKTGEMFETQNGLYQVLI